MPRLRSVRVLALVTALAPMAHSGANAVELRDAELVVAGAPVLENGSGTVRLEDGRLVGASRMPLPEPGFTQGAAGAALLWWLWKRRREKNAW